MEDIWKIDKETACCTLDDNHKLYITREESGIHIKVEENDSPNGRTNILFTKRLTDDQLGHTLTKRQYE